MRAVLQWIGTFLGTTVVVALLSGAVAAFFGYEPPPDGAVRLKETYDMTASNASIYATPGINSVWEQELDGVAFGAVDLTAPVPFNMVRLAVEGAEGTLYGATGAVGPNVDLEVTLPTGSWGGVHMEVDCGSP